MGWMLLLASLAGLACASAPLEGGTWIDLTHPFDADTIYWPTEQDFVFESRHHGPVEGGWWYEANSVCTAEHGGTHLDAPAHFGEGRAHTEGIPLERTIGPAFVVDVAERVAGDRDYLVGIEDLERFEAREGRLPAGAIVLLRTGFGRHWPDRERYLGTGRRGPEAVAELSFPGLGVEAARWLAEERGIGAVGIDTASIDRGRSRDFAAHRVLAAREIPIFENVASLERLPPTGAFVVALPMKIAGGSGGPLRIVARLP